ncbi:hypothetical protein BH09VER1_BH09VER1_44370 [soil metagenome]
MAFDEHLASLWDRMAADQDNLLRHFELGKALFERKDYSHAIPHLQMARRDVALLRPAVELLAESFTAMGIPEAAERARGYLRNNEDGGDASASPMPPKNPLDGPVDITIAKGLTATDEE